MVPLPASEETIILFVTRLTQRIKPQSINVYLAAVRSLHISQGLSNPLQPGLRLKQTLRGIERKHFSAPKQKMPLTFDILSDIQTFNIPTCDDDKVRWAAITNGHFLMLRAGEFTVPSFLLQFSLYCSFGTLGLCCLRYEKERHSSLSPWYLQQGYYALVSTFRPSPRQKNIPRLFHLLLYA